MELWTLIIIKPHSAVLLFIGRVLVGFSGAFSMLVPACVGEIAKMGARGRLSGWIQVISQASLVLTYFLGDLLSLLTSCRVEDMIKRAILSSSTAD